jgi:DNA-binding GntR family transcriptional regulator
VLAAGLAAERISEDDLEHLERLLVEIGDYIEKDDTAKIVEATAASTTSSTAPPTTKRWPQ